ncbi:uncharacterized protein [Nothobranchius furzeri]|uniref:uncharacterized protein n=1 Tax=Nothobranchius furzeri TaxID=105023 RepID=UPI0039048E63
MCASKVLKPDSCFSVCVSAETRNAIIRPCVGPRQAHNAGVVCGKEVDMDQFEERLAEEVWKYEHLYNPSLKNYKDAQVICNSWKEIARILEVDVEQCMKKWRSMWDKFVRMKKTLRGSSGDPGGKKKKNPTPADSAPIQQPEETSSSASTDVCEHV